MTVKALFYFFIFNFPVSLLAYPNFCEKEKRALIEVRKEYKLLEKKKNGLKVIKNCLKPLLNQTKIESQRFLMKKLKHRMN